MHVRLKTKWVYFVLDIFHPCCESLTSKRLQKRVNYSLEDKTRRRECKVHGGHDKKYT